MRQSSSLHSHDCNCGQNLKNISLQQTVDEMDFEKSIFNACVQGDLNKVKNMIEKNGKLILNKRDKNGYSCLHYAARNSHYEICKLLIENGIDLNLKTNSCRSTALHRAAFIGSKQIVDLLLKSGCDSLSQDCDGKNALHKCIEQYELQKISNKSVDKYLETIKIILKFNNELKNQVDNSNKKPFDYLTEPIIDII